MGAHRQVCVSDRFFKSRRCSLTVLRRIPSRRARLSSSRRPSLSSSTDGFAVASTDTGHNGTSGDGTFALNGPETQIDFGYRAVHLTTVYSKEILKLYYGKKQKTSYWVRQPVSTALRTRADSPRSLV